MKSTPSTLTILGIFGILALGKVALAQISIDNPLGANCTDVGCVLQRIAGFLFLIGGPILVIMVFYAAFLLLSSGGETEKVRTGQKALLWAVVGFAILLINWGFASIIREILGGGN